MLIVASFMTPPLAAKIGPTTLGALADSSEVIVVGHVERIDNVDNRRVARAMVVETWKGHPSDALQFDAEPSWTCDIADANVGETAVLFLSRTGTTATFSISHAGRGRMPLRQISGQDYATVWVGDVQLPNSVQTIEGPDPQFEFIRSASLTQLRSRVREHVLVSQRAAAKRRSMAALAVLGTAVVASIVWIQARKMRQSRLANPALQPTPPSRRG